MRYQKGDRIIYTLLNGDELAGSFVGYDSRDDEVISMQMDKYPNGARLVTTKRLRLHYRRPTLAELDLEVME